MLLDGRPVPVRVDSHLETGTQSVVSSQTFHFDGCSTAVLAAGWHTIESAPGTIVDDVRLTTGPPPPETTSAPLHTVQRAGGRVELRLNAKRGSRVILGESYDDHWRARTGGSDLGTPIALDTQTAWNVPVSGRSTLVADFTPERTYRIALVITGCTFVLCLVLAVRPRRRRSR